MSKNRQVVLTEGPILKALIALALPIMATSFLNTFYSITDMAWIGMLGSRAVAGVGVGGMYVWLSQGLSALAKMGGQVNVAQALGRGRRDEAGQYACSAVQLTVIFAVIFAAVCTLFTDELIALFHVGDAETVRYAVVYTRITCGLVIFSYLTFVLTGIYTAQGDSKTPLVANFLGLFVNVVLDPFIVMTVLVLGVIRDGKKNVLSECYLFRPSEKKYYQGIFRIGVPTALQSTAYCAISMVLTRMVADFGPAAVAVQRVGGQVEALSWNTADGFAASINAFSAQNYGAGKMDRIRNGYWIAFRTIAAWGCLIMALFFIFPEPLSEIFFHEAEAIQISVSYFLIIGISEAFMSVELMTIGALSGLGRTRLCSIISIVFTGSRIPFAMALAITPLGLDGIWWAMSLTSVVKGIIFTIVFHRITHNGRS